MPRSIELDAQLVRPEHQNYFGKAPAPSVAFEAAKAIKYQVALLTPGVRPCVKKRRVPQRPPFALPP